MIASSTERWTWWSHTIASSSASRAGITTWWAMLVLGSSSTRGTPKMRGSRSSSSSG
ncbi:hypothetical protein OV079_51580 [Nannocystis pusilla]|uniref:Uncharacterized protein n=1 Tax=Nannocystis pusilla TaxID=889268 RepID=A0A9X3F8Q2_9BACT|nr:hypothetical protein [Nannocystis pusilla]MCY1013833.1 hypothetical protein [Nannocystis pusilla]